MNRPKQNLSSTISLLLLAAAAFCLIAASCAAPQKQIANEPPKPPASLSTLDEAQTAFGIFLTANPNLDTRPGEFDLSQIQLTSPPVISADDIISYNFSDHSMKLRPEALARISALPGSQLVRGLPFVVVANGQRIYLGTFKTELSSIPSHVPSILRDRALLDKDQPADVAVIDRAYPSPSFGDGPDPRDDARIKNALADSHKLN